MALITQVKWAAGSYPGGSDAKYLAKLTMLESVHVRENAKDEENMKYECKIDAFFVGRPHETPEEIYKKRFSTLPEAMRFFSDLVHATGAVHCDATRESDFKTPKLSNKELAEHVIDRITGSIEELAESIARQK